MVYWVRSITPAKGKGKETRDWAVKVAKYWMEHYAGIINIDVVMNLSGPVNKIYFTGKYESLAAVEKAMESAASDPEWQKLLAERHPLEGPPVNSYYRVIE